MAFPGYSSLILAVVFTVLSIALFVGNQEGVGVRVTVLLFVGLFIVPVMSMLCVFRRV